MSGITIAERGNDVLGHPGLVALDRKFDALYAQFFQASSDVIALPDVQEEQAEAAYDTFLGTLALQQNGGSALIEQDYAGLERKNLSCLIEQAALGDEEAYAALEIDTHTTVIETILKEGNVTRITAEWSEEAGLVQYGRSYQDIQANALTRERPKALQERTETEGLNWKRIESCLRSGRLKDYYLVVISMVPDNATLEESRKEGFFVDTMTMVVQATTQEETGEVVTESAFMAGVEPGSRIRHDLRAARGLYQQWGVEGAEMMATTDFLQEVRLVPKASMMPNGVGDIVRMLDEQLGPDYFYGMRRSREDYAAFSQKCFERSYGYKNVTARAVAELLADHKRLAKDPAAAVQALYDAAKKHTVYKAVSDESINAEVFGSVAAQHINDLRMRLDWGWHETHPEEFDRIMDKAVKTAATTACGGGSKAKTPRSETADHQTPNKDGEGNMRASHDTKGQGKREVMKCVHCPLCNRKSVDAVIEYMPAKHIKRITCQSCRGFKEYSL